METLGQNRAAESSFPDRRYSGGILCAPAIAALVRCTRLIRSDITAHSLRHTFALAWLRQHPGQLIELSQLLGHESLDTTAVYTRASAADLARGVEQTPFNLDG